MPTATTRTHEQKIQNSPVPNKTLTNKKETHVDETSTHGCSQRSPAAFRKLRRCQQPQTHRMCPHEKRLSRPQLTRWHSRVGHAILVTACGGFVCSCPRKTIWELSWEHARNPPTQRTTVFMQSVLSVGPHMHSMIWTLLRRAPSLGATSWRATNMFFDLRGCWPQWYAGWKGISAAYSLFRQELHIELTPIGDGNAAGSAVESHRTAHRTCAGRVGNYATRRTASSAPLSITASAHSYRWPTTMLVRHTLDWAQRSSGQVARSQLLRTPPYHCVEHTLRRGCSRPVISLQQRRRAESVARWELRRTTRKGFGAHQGGPRL